MFIFTSVANRQPRRKKCSRTSRAVQRWRHPECHATADDRTSQWYRLPAHDLTASTGEGAFRNDAHIDSQKLAQVHQKTALVKQRAARLKSDNKVKIGDFGSIPSILEHPMRTQTIEGTSEQIARRVIEMDGRVVRAIVFIEEPLDAKPTGPAEDIFVEMSPFTVSVGNADDSRDSIYCQQDGE